VGELLSDSESSDNPLDVISDAEDPPPTGSTTREALAAAARSSNPDLYTFPSQAPATLRTALSGPAAREWGAVCQAKMGSLARMKTYCCNQNKHSATEKKNAIATAFQPTCCNQNKHYRERSYGKKERNKKVEERC
jgi:hypothetical protein